MDMYQKRKARQKQKNNENKEEMQKQMNINCDVRKNGKHLENMKYKAFNTNIYYIFLAFLYR